jgi:hypothetical protein
MIIIDRRQIWFGVKVVLTLAAIAAASLLLGVIEGWVIHRYMPDAMDDPWFWSYYTQTFSPTEEGCSVFIDLDKLQLILYRDGEEIKTYPVSGGKNSTPSPTGQWKVTEVGNWGEGFGGSWIAINCPWGSYGIHGTVEPWKLGNTNASHGCIRMRNKDVAELKEYLKWGTPVYIKHDGLPFRITKDGDRGSDVFLIQEMLLQTGYCDTEPDGRFGAGTAKAVREFQSNNNIKADGVVGWSTYELLKTLCD